MKSFALAMLLAVILCIYIMSIFNTRTNVYYSTFPGWVFIALIVILCLGLLLSLYWGITGIFKEQRLYNLLGIVISLFGLSFYVLGFVMEIGKGKETAGQFDHDISKIETGQQTALFKLLKDTNTKPADLQIVAYWKMHKNPAAFAICIQKGNIIALQVKDREITDTGNISKLTFLSWLILKNCGLKSIENLNLPNLERLEIDHNHLTSLAGLENSPKIGWLNFRDNPITDSLVLKQLNNSHLYIHH